MDAEVVGIGGVDYTSKKTGKPVKGVKLHCILSKSQNGLSGNAVREFFVSEKILPDAEDKIAVGQAIELFFDQNGWIEKVAL